MKILLLLSIGFIVLIFVGQLYFILSTNKTEQQKYSKLKEYEDFEIRYYPSSTLATINLNAKTYKELASPGFRVLAGYIFGGNEAKKSISMTTPVHMDISDSVSKMSFVMPSEYSPENLPKPNDPSITIKKTPAEYVAVIEFGGYASDAKLKVYSEKLQTLLKENHLNSIGHYKFFGYNPPYQFIKRKNEIVVAVEWKEK